MVQCHGIKTQHRALHAEVYAWSMTYMSIG